MEVVIPHLLKPVATKDPGHSTADDQKICPQILVQPLELRYLKQIGIDNVLKREQQQCKRCAAGLRKLGMQVFTGPHQAGTVSFVPGMDCETAAQILGHRGIAVRAGLHCAPLAHESAGTLETGTVRISFGPDANPAQTQAFLQAARMLL